jgi:hypothetical protein
MSRNNCDGSLLSKTPMVTNTRERIEKIHVALDLGFSDYFDKGHNVRESTIRNKLKIIEEAVAVMQVEEAINFSLLEALGPNHPSPQIYALDFPSDLRASFYLLLGGYYRQAILCLRNWLEMRLLGIYFGLIEQDRAKYDKWRLGEFAAPFGTRLIKQLFARAEFRKAEERFGLRDRLKSLYSELCAFTHGAGLEKYDLQANTDNVPRYNSKSVDLWFALMNRTFAEIVFCLFLAYRKDIFHSIQSDEIQTILAHVPAEYEHELLVAAGAFL